jgi:hypothetical protein
MEKPEIAEKEVAGNGKHHGKEHSAREGEIERIDALALAPETTLASFAHLDEKKILRKMDIRLIPMLALLYLLSFLDSEFLLRAHNKYEPPSLNSEKGATLATQRSKVSKKTSA